MQQPTTSDLSIRCADGVVLRGTEFRPGVEQGTTVIVCGAIFTRERFYARMARYLAGRGLRVITFANRGSGRSLAGGTPRLVDWGLLDLPAVIEHARSTRPTHRLFALGHSMGGQLVALSEAVHGLDGVVSVAATEAWWRHWPKRTRLGILGGFVAIPLLGRALDPIPADRFSLGPDLASSIARDWARWGRTRGYFDRFLERAPSFASYRGRVLAFSFDDDELLGCSRAVDALHRRYAQADVDRRHLAPNDVGSAHIGHFGFFRLGAGPRLWEETIAWMQPPLSSRP